MALNLSYFSTLGQNLFRNQAQNIPALDINPKTFNHSRKQNYSTNTAGQIFAQASSLKIGERNVLRVIASFSSP
jgi:hypothetical protein